MVIIVEKKSIALLLTVLLVASITIGLFALPQLNLLPRRLEGLKTFRNTGELEFFLEANTLREWYPGIRMPGVMVMESQAETPAAGPDAKASSEVDFSQTNVQVEGIDEVDYVKTDGEYIYLVSDNRIIIVKAYPLDEASVVSMIAINNTPIRGIYVYKDRLIAVAEWGRYYILEGPAPAVETVDTSTETKAIMPMPSTPITSVFIYDIQDRESPELVRNVSFTGWINDNRLLDNILYLVVTEPTHVYNYEKETQELMLPIYYINGEKHDIDPNEIYYSGDMKDSGFQYTILFAFDVESFDYDYVTILTGYTNVLYMSYNNIYLTQPEWRQDVFSGNEYKSLTKIYRFSVDGLTITPEAVGEVPGSINNQLQLDEYKGFLRVSTYGWKEIKVGPAFRVETYTNIFVLNMDLDIVGSITGIAESEQLYATRFMGDYAYLVTFRRIDPFFVIDLSNPTSPKILGELKIPGFSSMLQPLWNNLVLGIGYEVDNQTRIMRLKLSLFDVSDPSNPKEIGKLIYKEAGWAWSEAAYNHRAILKIDKYNYVGIPVKEDSVYIDPATGVKKLREGYLMINASIEGLEKAGLLIIERTLNETNWYWSPYTRGVYIDNILYIVTTGQINIYQLPNLQYNTTIAISLPQS